MKENPKRKNWNQAETETLILLYQRMVALEQSGKLGAGQGKTSKAKLIRQFQETYPHRTRGSIEMKLMNISYCREQAGLPIVKGYKPLPNCSLDLREFFNVKGGE